MPPFAQNNSAIDPQMSPMIHKNASHTWSFIGASETIQLPSDGAIDLSKPSVQAGDLAFVTLKSSPIIATPAGWLLVNSGALRQYRRTADGTASDNFPLPVGTGNDAGRVAIYIAFRPPATPIVLRNSGMVQRIGVTEFVWTAIAADPGFTQTIIINGAHRNGLQPTQVPVFSNITSPPNPGIRLAAELYADWAAFGQRFDYLACSYKLETNADAINEGDYVYSPWEDALGAGTGSIGATVRFRT